VAEHRTGRPGGRQRVPATAAHVGDPATRPAVSRTASADQPPVVDAAAAGRHEPRAHPGADHPSCIALPLPAPQRTRRFTPTARYAMTSCDRQGRLADRSCVKAMGWTPNQPVALTAGHDIIVVRATSDGRQALTGHGFLRLPAAIRHRCHLRTGDRLLVAAHPGEHVIVYCALAVLEEFLSSRIGALP
jgi:hypothetical protein